MVGGHGMPVGERKREAARGVGEGASGEKGPRGVLKGKRWWAGTCVCVFHQFYAQAFLAAGGIERKKRWWAGGSCMMFVNFRH